MPHISYRDAGAYINGAFEFGDGPELTVKEKATGEALATIRYVDENAVDRAAAAARTALPAWAALPYQERCAYLVEFGRVLAEMSNEIAELVVRETGSIRGKADYEVAGSIEELFAAAAIARRPVGEVLRSSAPGRTSTSVRRPVGVVAVLTPWNFPLILAMRAVAPALALGNVVILKPSPETPLTGALALADIATACGFPAGVFQVVVADLPESRQLVEHPEVDMVHFTGSTAVGSQIASSAGRLLKRASLELGGNNSIIVMDDVDLDYASMLGAWSSFHYQGQTCISASRHIVHSSIAEAYAQRVAERARGIVVGNPLDDGVLMGPMINERQRDRAYGLLQKSVDAGATIIEGGHFDGLFFRPTVVTGVTVDMPLWSEEVFGPIAPITTFDTDDEAIALVNGSGYGLVNSIVTADEARGARLAERISSGMIHINDATCIDEASAPFGGIGQSGLGGRSGGEANYEEFTERHWLTTTRQRLEYPY